MPFLALAVLVMWMLFPLALRNTVAQDAVPLLVAGDLVVDDVDAVYEPASADLYDLSPEFRERSCAFYPDVDQCSDEAVAFISPPLALPVLSVVAQLDTTLGIFLIRLAAASALAVGFAILVRSSCRPDDVVMPTVAAAALLLDVYRQVELGQSSALLFLLASLPIVSMRTPKLEAAAALLLVAAVASKAFPVVLVIPLLIGRRWRLLAMAGGALAVAMIGSLLLGPSSLWREFYEQSRTVARVSSENPYNASPAAVAEVVGLPGGATTGMLLGLIAAVVLGRTILRRGGHQLAWAATIPLVLLVLPQVWNHYVVVGLPVLVVAAVQRAARPDRWLVAGAIALLPYGLASGEGVSQAGLILLAGSLVATVWLLVRPVAPAAVAIPDSR